MKKAWKFLAGLFLVVSLILFFSNHIKEEFHERGTNRFPPYRDVYKFRDVKFDASKIDNSLEKYIFDKRLKNNLFKSINMMTEPDKKPKITLIQEIDKGKYIEKKVSLVIYPLTLSYAYILTPKNVSLPAPLVFAMHQHGGFYEYGKEEVAGNKGDPNLFYGKELAERGYIVFAMDAPLFGDRNLGPSRTGNSPEVFENLEFQSLISLRHSLLGETLREDISILNLVSDLENIDKNNIGCIGHSFGGVRCMYLAALDKRVKTVVLSNSVADLRRHKENSRVILQSWYTILPGAAEYTETNGILALIAPRPLMVISSENDPIFPFYEAEEQTKKVSKLYNELGRSEDFVFLKAENESHTFSEKYREDAYIFLDKHLKNQFP